MYSSEFAVTPCLPPDMIYLAIALEMMGKFAVTSGFSVVYAYTAEVYPTMLRHTAVSTCTMISRMGSIISPYFIYLSEYRSLSRVRVGALPFQAWTSHCSLAVCAPRLNTNTKSSKSLHWTEKRRPLQPPARQLLGFFLRRLLCSSPSWIFFSSHRRTLWLKRNIYLICLHIIFTK